VDHDKLNIVFCSVTGLVGELVWPLAVPGWWPVGDKMEPFTLKPCCLACSYDMSVFERRRLPASRTGPMGNPTQH
jgi:hypothetical protein